MAKCLFGGWLGVVVMLACLVATGGMAQAAGEWEWTQGEGWVQGAGVSRPTAKEQLAYAYELEQKGEFMDAARQYFLLIQNFPDATESGVGLQRLAKCLFEMENYYTSYKAIEQVIKTYPNTGRMTDLIEIELRVAKKMLVSQASASVFDDHDIRARDTNTRRAIEIVDSVLDHDPYGPVAPEALLVKGEAHLYINEIAAARGSFDRILDEFSKSDVVERARLGILRCDSLMGQARPQEVYEQIQVVRDAEANRERDSGEWDEFDDVEESINQLAEVEAAKMMEQAAQYRRMGTHNAVKSAEFLYKEVVRRYPHTPQADEAREKVGGMKIPPEQGRVAKAVKSINLNPFTWNRDPEPPWIVPQLSPEDTVMIDSGIGPIAGVPETDFVVAGGVGVRPAALDNATVSSDMDMAAGQPRGDAPFSPIDAGPPASPPIRGGEFSSLPSPPLGGLSSGPGSLDLEPARVGSPVLTSPNPIPSIPESDLIGGGYPSGGLAAAPAGQPAPAYAGMNQYPEYPAVATGTGSGSPLSLGPIPDAALADLIPPARRPESSPAYQPPPQDYYQPQPQTSYQTPGYSESPATGAYQAAPTDYYYQQPPFPEPSYYPEPAYSAAPVPPAQPYAQPAPYGGQAPVQGGGWMLDDDFR